MNQAQRNKLQDAITALNGSVDRDVLNAVVHNLRLILEDDQPFFWLIENKSDWRDVQVHRRGCQQWSPATHETVDDFQASEIVLAWNHWREVGFDCSIADCCR